MSRGAAPLPDCWGFDTASKLTATACAGLFASSHEGHPLTFAWRYVGLGQPSPGDITVPELDAVLSSGLALLLVQHVRYPGWTASKALGQADGQAAAHHAKLVGYAAGSSLAMDLEGCATVGQTVFDHCAEWARIVRAEGFSPVLYVGYAAGLTPVALGQLPFDAFWSDYGQRSVQPMGFACKQYAQTMIAGVGVDPDHAYPDMRGATLVAMVDGIYHKQPDPGLPAIDEPIPDTEPGT